MADGTEKGWTVSPRGISAAVGLLGLISAAFMIVTTVNGYSFRLEQLESDKIELVTSITDLSGKLNVLNIKIVELTIALNRLQDRQELQQGIRTK